jgi:CubicO group peptidase (beta-lactamase class C family)
MATATRSRHDPCLGQAGARDDVARAIDARELGSRIGRILHRRSAVGFAMGVVRDGRFELFHAHGLADIASGAPVTENTIFRIASITKTFTAIALMQLLEQGLVDLDAPANDYLRAFRLIPADPGFRPATVRHLLTHTAGVPQVVNLSHALRHLSGITVGESYKVGERMPTLAEYYGGRLRLVGEPGTSFTYSDHSFATLGQIVEDVSGQPLARVFRERIFEPLGMADTSLLRSDLDRSRLATGYTLGPRGPRAVVDREWMTAAASSICSTPRDMARYLAALLGRGSSEHGSILEPATLASMFDPHYRTDARVPGMGLGFFRVDLGGHLAVEHQGLLPGFNSQVFVAPADGVGVMAFTNGARGAMFWLAPECGRLVGDLIGVPHAGIRADVPQHPETWGDICGWYPTSAQLTDTQAWGMFGLGVEVFVRGGRLMLRTLSPIPAALKGFPLDPDDVDDPYVFRLDLTEFGIGVARVVFSHDAVAGTTRVHTDLVARSLERRPHARNPRVWISRALAAAAIATVAGRVRRRRAPRHGGGAA